MMKTMLMVALAASTMTLTAMAQDKALYKRLFGSSTALIPATADPASGKALFDQISDPATAPIKFTYGGRLYRALKGLEIVSDERTPNGSGGWTRIVRVKVDETLQVRLECFYNGQWGETEYVVYFSNPSKVKSALLKDVTNAEIAFAGENPVLRGILGDHGEHYSAYEQDLMKGDKHFLTNSGRATHHVFPYFDLVHGDGGTLIAIGWAGTWEAFFGHKEYGTLFRAKACLRISLNLLPGEEIRMGRIVLLPYVGRDKYGFGAMNLWRAWFRACNMPRANAAGDPIEPFSTVFFAYDTGLPNSDGSISERFFTWKPTLDKLVAEQMLADFRWFDAGWYCDPAGNTVEKDWWGTVGCWEVDREKWPDATLRESNDACRKVGMKAYCWFEPERVTHVDDLVKNFDYKREWAVPNPNFRRNILNNIGNDECRKWTFGRIVKVLEESGFDLYREDNNSNPEPCWLVLDKAECDKYGCDRWGVNEIKCICGHYQLWDEIIAYCASKGKCTFIDSCASGGGRNDIESLRRAVPFLRSDADRAKTPLRLSMTTTFCRWIPMHGASTKETENELKPSEGAGSNVYVARASYLPIYHMSEAYVHNPKLDWDLARRNFAEWKSVRHLLVRDFYPLTPWHYETEDDYWAVFAYDVPERGESILLAFRQLNASKERFIAKLPFVDADSAYEVVDADTNEKRSLTGVVLREGLEIVLPEPKSSKLFRITRHPARMPN
jgi:alpha-galactosidase